MRREIKIGLTVIFALLLLYLALAWVSGSRVYPGTAITYHIQFSDISGLLEGDPVLYRGYQLGRVNQIIPNSDHIDVAIELKQDVTLYEDAYAEIQPKEIMGGKQIQLVQGTQSQNPLNSKELPGYTSLDFSSGFSRMGKMLDQIEGSGIAPLMAKVDTLFSQTYQLLNAIDPHTLSTTTALLNQNLQRLHTILLDIQQKELINKVDTTLQDINLLATEGTRTLRTMQRMIERTDTTLLRNLELAADSLPSLMVQTSSLLHTTQDLLDEENGLVGKMIRDSTLYIKVDSTLGLLNQVLKQIQEDKIIVGFKRRKTDD